MSSKAKNVSRYVVCFLMALVMVLGLIAPAVSVAHADEVTDSQITTTANDQSTTQVNDADDEEEASSFLSAGYLIPVCCVLAVLIGFYVFLSVKTGKKKPKKPTGKKPVKKP